MRAQVSLLFQDKDLYDNLIVPYKESRELSDLILRCLSAYYYDEKVRLAVEGIDTQDAIDTSEVSSIISSIRETLFVQGLMTEEIGRVASDGSSTILSQINKRAKDMGVYEKKESEFSNSVYRINLLESDNKNIPVDNTVQSKDLSLEEMVTIMWKQFTSGGVRQSEAIDSVVKEESVTEDIHETVRTSKDTVLSKDGENEPEILVVDRATLDESKLVVHDFSESVLIRIDDEVRLDTNILPTVQLNVDTKISNNEVKVAVENDNDKSSKNASDRLLKLLESGGILG